MFKKVQALIKRKHFKKVLVSFLLILALGGLISTVLIKQNKLSFSNPFSASKEPIDDTSLILEEIGSLIVLPKGEMPTIATVSDKTKLVGQSFFKNAENGDRVIIYQKSGKAILYRPSIKKIIEAASLTSPLGASESSGPVLEEDAKKEEKKYRIALYNSTQIPGFTRTKEAEIEKKMSNIEVVERKNAIGDYAKTLVIDLKGDQGEFAKALAGELSAEISELPEKESKPTEADFLIILAE